MVSLRVYCALGSELDAAHFVAGGIANQGQLPVGVTLQAERHLIEATG